MRILLVDEADSLTESVLSEYESNFVVDVAYNTEEGTYLSQVNDYDGVVVNTCTYDDTKLNFCKSAREACLTSPILFISDKKDPEFEIKLLEAGADFFIYSPASAQEINQKLSLLIRKFCPLPSKKIFTINEYLKVNLETREVLINNEPVEMRRKEYEILEYLVLNSHKTVSKEELLEHIWSEGIYILSNTLEVQLKNLRDKIEKPYNTQVIKTVRGFGYQLISSI